MQLNRPDVFFDQENHTYEYRGVFLTSVTKLIKKHVMPNLYVGADPALLEEKRQYGTMVHDLIEQYHMGILCDVDNADVQAYIDYMQTAGVRVITTEYLVSDCLTNAGKLDQLRIGSNGELQIADVKTTYALNMEYLSIQLSLYAYDFEKQNPGLHISKLVALHVRDGKCKEVEVPFLGEKFIPALLEAEVTGEVFHDPYKAPDDDAQKLLVELREIDNKMIDLSAAIKPLEERKTAIKKSLYALAREKEQTGFELDGGVVKVGNDVTTSNFSLDKLKESAPKFFNRYAKKFNECFVSSKRNGAVTYKFK